MNARSWRTQVLEEYEKNSIPTYEEINLINDYLTYHPHQDYTNKTVQEVKAQAIEWFSGVEQECRPGFTWTRYRFKDGYTIKHLTSWQSKKYEASYLRHCSYSHHKHSLDLYSLRDDNNKPLVTLCINGGHCLSN